MVYQVKHLERGKAVQLSEVFIESEVYLQAQVSFHVWNMVVKKSGEIEYSENS